MNNFKIINIQFKFAILTKQQGNYFEKLKKLYLKIKSHAILKSTKSEKYQLPNLNNRSGTKQSLFGFFSNVK
jgi:hypothetical protein